MHAFLLEDRVGETGVAVYDHDPARTALRVTATGEIEVLFPSANHRRIRLPFVPCEGWREVSAAAERLFARAAMMAPPVREADLESYFKMLGIGPCAHRVTLAGEELALPYDVGVVARWDCGYGMFLYAEHVVRVSRRAYPV